MTKIVLVDQEMPHYRAQVLSALQESLSAELVVYSPPNWEWQHFLEPGGDDIRFQHKRIKAKWFPRKKLLWLNYFKILAKEGRPDILILRHWVRHPLLIPFLFWCRIRGIRVVVWGQGFSRNRSFRPYCNVFDALNLLIVKLGRAYVGYSDAVIEALARYEKREKLFVARNTLNLKPLDSIIEELESEGKASVKQRIGLDRADYLIFVGRLQKRKRVDFLIAAFLEIVKAKHDVGLLIVGDGPEREDFKKHIEGSGSNDIRLLGAMDFRESSPYLFCSDVMVIPGWLGLAVNHGFRFGLPVVTCAGNDNGTGHPPEIEWLQDGVNGKVSKSETPVEFGRDILEALRERKTLGHNAREFYEKNLSAERMIEGFKCAIDYASRT